MIVVSVGHKRKFFGGVNFSQAYLNGCIELYGGSMPASPNDAPGASVIGRITRNGGVYTHGMAANSLNYELNDFGEIRKPAADVWALSGLANGVVTWGRVFSGTDSKTLSATDARIDFQINPLDGSGMFITDTTLAVATQRECTFFLLAIPPYS